MGLRLTGERLEEIKERVVSMYERFDINCVPISSFELATKMGIKVIPYSAYNERVQAISDTFDISFEAACYALSYYNKWLAYGGKTYTSYEIKILNLFEKAI